MPVGTHGSVKAVSPRELRDVLAGAAANTESDDTIRAFKKVKEEVVVTALEELAREHETAARSYRLVCIAGAWQFVSQPEYAPWLKALSWTTAVVIAGLNGWFLLLMAK